MLPTVTAARSITRFAPPAQQTCVPIFAARPCCHPLASLARLRPRDCDGVHTAPRAPDTLTYRALRFLWIWSLSLVRVSLCELRPAAAHPAQCRQRLGERQRAPPADAVAAELEHAERAAACGVRYDPKGRSPTSRAERVPRAAARHGEGWAAGHGKVVARSGGGGVCAAGARTALGARRRRVLACVSARARVCVRARE